MKTLLTAIKDQLINQLSFVRASDIVITEDAQLLPKGMMFPAVMIKDGEVTNQDETNQTMAQSLQVEITVYARILRAEASIMGDTGVLALEQWVIDALRGNDLGLGFWRAFPIRQLPSMLFGDEQQMVQAKTIIFEYNR